MKQNKQDSLWKQALELHEKAIVIDTHCDTPELMIDGVLDISKKNKFSNVDLVKMKEGGVDAVFFVVYVSNKLDKKHPSIHALNKIDEIHRQAEQYRQFVEIARSPQDIKRIHSKHKKAIVLALENGGAIEGNLRILRDYYRLGIQYITLTHFRNNDICDSSGARKPRWNGLSPFGKKVVTEMNRLGMLIDVSHISDKAFYDVLKESRAPVVASHSSARAICDVPRNMNDDMIRALAKKGGVMQINFYSEFIDYRFHQHYKKVFRKHEKERENIKKRNKNNVQAFYQAATQLRQKYAPPAVDADKLIEHIDHVVKLVGVDYVGLGSDYDGADYFPAGLETIASYPLITYKLLQRGYSEEEIVKILGGNFLRVWEKVTEEG
ncbi:MAG: hypothetical protein A2Y62_13690 [Candidatus Fischerbacteria bacterium RBG_13_37_8]|uniref:Membrane dipeptidase n=1 Tax=Candidatus Fischerbacteria bacterium RBG_13_37_8 TaxID=1817863 RepID=A0A1F5V7E2_9BACT|nr:MAG: hypothetical protein A2Y62_13690 [Candidatus Fischerbacteria bacterium RBG_13_37_8]